MRVKAKGNMTKILKGLFVLMTCALAACQPGTITPAPVTATVSTDPPLPPTSTETPTEVPTETATLVPTAPPSTVELEGAELPDGFSLIKFADVPSATAIAFDSSGKDVRHITVIGRVYILEDVDHDGRADSVEIYSSGYSQPLGVAVHASTGDVYVSRAGPVSSSPGIRTATASRTSRKIS
jgi:glucose/arabinose dehydrogenase